MIIKPIEASVVLDDVVDHYQSLKFGFGCADYYPQMLDTYRRTIYDIINLDIKKPRDQQEILEIGSLTGIVSTALSRCGYPVTAHDIPKVINDPDLQNHYAKEGITPMSFLLQDYPLPLESGRYDVIVFCEVLEHLNFNPLFLLSEFNRILKPDGIVYVATPNQASLVHRLMLLRGQSFYFPVTYFEDGIDPESLAAFGYHWHEFTKSELEELFALRGFRMIAHQYCRYIERTGSNAVRRWLVSSIYKIFPALMQCQAAVFQKSSSFDEFPLNNLKR
jgi:2-polyprenyl-3-methyl-5-hydroxy-6-metoxy-1,4-benzoquinol methylase